MFWYILFILLVGILIGFLLGRRFRRHLPVPPPPVPAHKIPDQFDASSLATTLGGRLAGTPANGAGPGVVGSADTPKKVIWVDTGDEVLAHLDSIQVKILDRIVLISIDLESYQTGRTPMILSFALGNAGDPAGLIAVTDEYPRGDGALASRWGEVLQAALWSTLLGIAQDHAAERGKAPSGISATTGVLTLRADNPIGAQA
jgi:hypothetical protein